MALLLAVLSSCASVAESFRTVHLTAGAEVATARFFTSVHGLPRTILQSDESDWEPRYHAEPVGRPRPFYTIGSNPSTFPFIGKVLPLFDTFVRYDLVLTSEKTWRGELFNYPDDGRIGRTPFEALFFETFPLDGVLVRRMDYVFRQFYVAARVYIGFFGEAWDLALRTSYGQARYDLLLIQSGLVRSDVRNHYRPTLRTGVLLRYRIGRHFKNKLVGRTYLFMETSTESSRRGAVRTELLRSNGSNPSPLYVAEDEFRLGVTRSLDLW